MKKILSVLMLSLVALMGLVFVGCKDEKINIEVYFRTSTAEGEEYSLLSKNDHVNITLDADSADDVEYYIDIRVKITKGKVNISDKAILLNNTSDAITVPASVDFDEDLQVAIARVIINGGGAPILTIKSTEGGSVEIPINIEIPVTGIEPNLYYHPAVVARDNTMTLDSSKLLSFYPNNSRRVTTQRGVTYTSKTPGVSVKDNKLVFGDDYQGGDITLTATSSSDTSISTDVNIAVVSNLGDYPVTMNYDNGQPIDSNIDLYAKSDYSTVGVTLALGTDALLHSDSIAVSHTADKKNVVSITGTDVFNISALQKNTVNVTFAFEYQGLDFAGQKPVATKTVKVNVKELASNMQINNISADNMSYYVYDTYEGKDGLELYFRAIPLTSEAKIHLSYVSTDDIGTLLVTKNGNAMAYTSEGYVLENNDKLVLSLKKDATISATSTIEMQAKLLTTPKTFAGKDVEAQYVTKTITLTPKKIYTNVELMQGTTTCDTYSATQLARGKDSEFRLDFSPENVDIANTTITLKKGNVTLMDGNKIVKSQLTSDDLSRITVSGKTVYSFYLRGNELGDDTLTISNINGYSKSYALQVVNASDNPTVTYQISDKTKTNVGYFTQDGNTYRLAIKNRSSVNMYSVTTSTIKNISLRGDVRELSNGQMSDNIAVNASIFGNDLTFTAQKESTSIYIADITTFGVDEYGVVSDKVITCTFEIAVYEPVSAFGISVSDTTVYTTDSVSQYLRDQAKAEINVNFNQNTATQTLYFTNDKQDCYSIIVSADQATLSGLDGNTLKLDSKKVTVSKADVGTVYVTFAVKQFGKSTSNTITQEINFVEATPAEGILLGGDALVEHDGLYTMNFGGTDEEKTFTATVSNASASFKDLMFKIYDNNGQEISNGSIVFVSYDADKKAFTIQSKKGGNAILKIMSKSNIEVTEQISISVSDGETTPYQIFSVDDFRKINNSSSKYVIAQDLDFAGENVHIGSFGGTLDGDMSILSLNADGSVTTTTIHSSISNIDLKTYYNLIETNTGIIQNINFKNVYCTSNIGSAGQTLSSANVGLVGENRGTISNVYVDFRANITTYLDGTTSQTVNIGALAGVNEGSISSSGKMCDSDITLTISSSTNNTTSTQNVGGIVGLNNGTVTGGYTYDDRDTKVSDLATSATGIVKISVVNSSNATENSHVGGVAGASEDKISGVSIITRGLSAGCDLGGIAGTVNIANHNNDAYIYECVVQNPYITGTGTNQNIGGVVGWTNANLLLTGVHFVKVYDTCGIIGSGNIGGIAGMADSAVMTFCYVENFINGANITGSGYIGGLVGKANGATVERSYANMDISANEGATVSGIIGTSENSKIENCYFIGNVTNSDGEPITIDNTYSNENNVTTSYAVINDVGYINGNEQQTLESMKNQSSYSGFTFISTLDDKKIWSMDKNKNNGYPYLVYYKDNDTISGDMLTIVPNDMTAEINADYVTKYDAQTGIVYYYEALGDADATAKNRYRLITEDDDLGIINLTIAPNNGAKQYTMTVVEGNTIAYISDGYLVLKNAGATSHKVVVRITATYNTALTEDITLYVMQNYENFGIYTTADKLQKDQLINGKQLIVPTNSNRSLYVKFDNGDYVVGSGYKIELTSDKNTGNVLTIDGGEITIGGISLDMANLLDLSVADFSDSTNGGYIIYNITAKVVYDYSQLDASLKGQYESAEQTFKIAVKKQATSLRVSTDEISMASDGYESFDVVLNTNFLSSDTVETSSSKIISTSRLGSETQDEIRVSITAINDYTTEWYERQGVSRIEDLFNFYISGDKSVSGIKYSLDFELVNERDIRYITEELSFDINITSLSNIALADTISLKIQPKVLSDILAYHYADGEMTVEGGNRQYAVKETSSNLIIPGGTGLLKIDLDPIYSYIDRVEITSSALSDGTRIAFEQMLLCEDKNNKDKTYYITNYPRPEVIDNGLSLELVSNSDKTYDGTLYVRTALPSLLAVSEYFTVTLKGYIGDDQICENEIRLLTQYKPGVVVNVLDAEEITIDGSQKYLIQTNSDTQLFTVEVYGYDYSGMPIITAKDTEGTLLSGSVKTSLVSSEFTNRNSQLLTYRIEALKGLQSNTQFTIDITLSLFINGKNQAESKSLSFISTDAILKGVSLGDGVIYDDEVTLAIGGNIPLALNWTTQGTDGLNSAINEALLKIGKDALLKLYSTQTTNSAGLQTKKDFSTYTSSTGIFITKYIEAENAYRLFAKSSVSKLPVNFTVYYRYVYENDKVGLQFLTTDSGQSECYKLSFDFALTIYADTTENNPIPVYTAENLKSMVAGQNYILMTDITLTDWEPLDINTEGQSIASLDGNNKVITIHSFAPKRYDDSTLLTSANVGLFAQVYSNTLLKNITIDVSQLSDTDMTQFTTYNFGVLAGVNNGLIVNCDIINKYKEQKSNIRIIGNETSDNGTNKVVSAVGGFVGVNYGNITNSRIGSYFVKIDTNGVTTSTTHSYPFTINAYGTVAGFVATNAGIISNCYSVNVGVTNLTSKENDSKTAGFVAENTKTIKYSYVKGSLSTISSLPDANGIPQVRAKGVKVYSNSYSASFVFSNSGDISDSFANINADTYSGTVAGFVYNNSGTITNVYTTANVDGNSTSKAPFVGVNVRNEFLNTGEIVSSYYLDMNSDSFAIDGDTARGISISGFNSTNVLNTFNIMDDANGIWTFNTSILDDGRFVSDSGLLPELTTANMISRSVRVLDEKSTTDDKNVYEYVGQYTLGKENNPYLIRNAEEFKRYLSSNGTSSTFTEHARLIDNITVSREYDVSKLTFKGSLEGNGLAISGIDISWADETNATKSLTSLGLFARLEGATFKNVTLNIINVSGSRTNYVGGLAGVIADSVVVNVDVLGGTKIVGNNIVGGLAGIITGDSHIENITTGVSALAGYNSQNSNNEDKQTVREINYSNEYIREDDFATNAVQKVFSANANAFSDETTDYATYVGTLSYAGGLAGVLDLDGATNLISNVKKIQVNTSTSSLSADNTVKVSADIAGGIAGYVGAGTHLSRAQYIVNKDNTQQYITGRYAVGGIVGMNLGYVSLSQIGYDTETQKEFDTSVKDYLKTESTVIPTIDLLRSNGFAGGFVGINLGGQISNSLTRVSVYNTSITGTDDGAKVLGGFAGATLAGEYNNVFNTGAVYVGNVSDGTNAVYTEEGAQTSGIYSGGFIGLAIYGTKTINKDQDLLRAFYTARNTVDEDTYNIKLNKAVAGGYIDKTLEDDGTYKVKDNYGLMIGSMHKNVDLVASANSIGATKPVDTFASIQTNTENCNIVKRKDDKYNIETFNILDLLDLDNPVQPAAFEKMFGEWSTIYWTLDNTYYYPLLLQLHYDDSYEIWTEDDFAKIIEDPYATYIIRDDITINSHTQYIVDEFYGKIFGEKLDGGMPTVSVDLCENHKDKNGTGFFRETNGADIKNINFSINIKRNENDKKVGGNTGSVVATAKGATSLTNIIVSGEINSQNTNVGGLVGNGADNGSDVIINNCQVSSNITATNATAVGGIAGALKKTDKGMVRNTTYIGTLIVNTDKGTDVGGIAGALKKTDKGMVRNTTYIGTLIVNTDKGTDVGGLVGVYTSGSVTETANTTVTINVTGKDTNTVNVGGLVGNATDVTLRNNDITPAITVQNASSASVGGLIGNSTGNLAVDGKNIIHVGDITVSNVDTTNVGGAVGCLKNADISKDNTKQGIVNCYNYANISVSKGENNNIGTLVGKVVVSATISSSMSHGTLTVTNVTQANVGMVGQAINITIQQSLSADEITANVGKLCIGGLVGNATTVTLEHNASVGKLFIEGAENSSTNTPATTATTTASTTTTTKCTITEVTAGGLVGGDNTGITALYNYSATMIDVTRLARTATANIHALVGSGTLSEQTANSTQTQSGTDPEPTTSDPEPNQTTVTNRYISDIVTYTDTVGQNAYFGDFTKEFTDYKDNQGNTYWARYTGQDKITNVLPYPAVLADEIERSERGTDACLINMGNVLYPIIVSDNGSGTGIDSTTKNYLSTGKFYYYNLTDDLTVSEELGKFTGVLMGHGHTIKTEGKHLFSYIDAHSVVSDIKIDLGTSKTFDIHATDVSYDGSLAKANAGTVFMCYVDAINLKLDGTKSTSRFGGLLGINVGRVYACGSTIEIKDITGNVSGVSGLVYINGTSESITSIDYTDNKPLIDYSYFTGYIADKGADGIERVGFVHTNDGYIRNSYSAGVVVDSQIFAFDNTVGNGSVNYFDYYASLGQDKGEKEVLTKAYTSDIYDTDAPNGLWANGLWTNGNKSDFTRDEQGNITSTNSILIYNYGYPIFNSGLDVLDLCTGETGKDILISHLGVLAKLVGDSSLYSVDNKATTFRLVYDIDLSKATREKLVEKWIGIGTDDIPFTAIFTTGTRAEVQSAQTAQAQNNQASQSTQTTTSQTAQAQGNQTSQSTQTTIEYTTMTITGLVGSGLFGVVSKKEDNNNITKGIITNVHMCDITDIASTGGAIANTVTAGEISECFVSGEITGENDSTLGGIVGSIASGYIKNCNISGEITGTSTVGGIAGEVTGAVTISNNTFGEGENVDPDNRPNSLTITGGADNVGGIVGTVTGSNVVISNNCATDESGVTVTIKYGNNATVGGIVGSVSGSSASATIKSNSKKSSGQQTNTNGSDPDISTQSTSENTNVVTYAFAGKESNNQAKYLGGVVGDNTGTITVTDNLITLGTMDANVIGGIVAKSSKGNIYSNTITGGGNLTNVAIFGGVIGYLDGGTTIGETGKPNISQANFIFASVSVEFTITDEDNKTVGTFQGYGGIVGVMTGGTITEHTLGGALNVDKDIDNFDKLNNVGGLVGYMSGGSIGAKALTGTGTITVQGYSNVGGVVGYYDGKVTANITLEQVYNGKETGGTTTADNTNTKQIAKVYGVENVGGIFGQYKVEYDSADSDSTTHFALSNFTNKNTLHFYSWHPNGYENAGGIAGFIDGLAQINDCYNYASLGRDEDAGAGNETGYFDYIGGITGKLEGKCGDWVEDKDDNGDIIYKLDGAIKLSNLYNYGSIYGKKYVGGIIGYSTAGLSGDSSNGTKPRIICANAPDNNNNGTGVAGGPVVLSNEPDTDQTVISGDRFVGGIIGYLTADIDGTNIIVKNEATVQAFYSAGGIVGYSTGSIATVTNAGTVQWRDGKFTSANEANRYLDKGTESEKITNAGTTITVTNDIGFGGIVGLWEPSAKDTKAQSTEPDIKDPDAIISSVTNTGAVTGFINAGGIVGHAKIKSGVTATIIDSINGANNTGGAVTGNYNVGGIVGKVSSTTGSTDSAATLSITGTTNNGAVTGNFYSETSDIVYGGTNVGGIVGYLYTMTHTSYTIGNMSNNKYALVNNGAVNGKYNVGGIVGYIYAGSALSAGDVNITAQNVGTVTVGALKELTHHISDDNGEIKIYTKDTSFSAEEYGVGGIIGKTGATLTSLTAENTGTVSARESTNVGGIIGLHYLGSKSNSTNPTPSTSVNITLDNTTSTQADPDITKLTYDVTATTAVTGQTNVGGVIGYINDRATDRTRTIKTTSTNTSGSNGGGGGTSRSVRTTDEPSLSTITIGNTTAGNSITGTTNVGGVIGKAKVNNIKGVVETDTNDKGEEVLIYPVILSNTTVTGINASSSVGGVIGYMEGNLSNASEAGKHDIIENWDMVSDINSKATVSFTENGTNYTTENSGGVVGTVKDATVSNLSATIQNIQEKVIAYDTDKDGNLKIDTDKKPIPKTTIMTTQDGYGTVVGKLKITDKYNIDGTVTLTVNNGNVTTNRSVKYSKYYIGNLNATGSSSNDDRYYLIDSIENQNYLDAFYTSNGTYAMVLDRELNQFNTFVSYTNLDDIYYNEDLNLTGKIRCIYRAQKDSTDKQKSIKVYNDYWRVDGKYDGNTVGKNPFNYSDEGQLVKLSTGEKWANVGVVAGYFAAGAIGGFIAPGAPLGDALAAAWLAVAQRWVSSTITTNIGLKHSFVSVAKYDQGLNYFSGEINNYENLNDIESINTVYKLYSFADEDADTYTYQVGDKTHHFSYMSAKANDALSTWNMVVKKYNGKYGKTDENGNITEKYDIIPYGVHEYKFKKIDESTGSNDELSYTYVKNTDNIQKYNEYTKILETIKGTNNSGQEITATVCPYIVLDTTNDGYALLGREMLEYKYIEVDTDKTITANDKYTHKGEQYTVVQVNNITNDESVITNKYVLLGKSLDVNTDDMHALGDDYMPKYYKYISNSYTKDEKEYTKVYAPYEPTDSIDTKTVYYQYAKESDDKTMMIYAYTKLNTLNIDNAFVYDGTNTSSNQSIEAGDTILKYKDGKYEILIENLDVMNSALNNTISDEIKNGYSIIVIDHVPKLVDGLILSQGQVITLKENASKSAAVDKAKERLINNNGFYTALYYSSDNVQVHNSKGTKSTGKFNMTKILKDLDINTSNSSVTLNEELSYIHHIDKVTTSN